jgi:hypothetical protein
LEGPEEVRDTRHRGRCNPEHLAGAAEATSIRELLRLWRRHFDWVGYIVVATTMISVVAMYFVQKSVARQTGDRTVW